MFKEENWLMAIHSIVSNAHDQCIKASPLKGLLCLQYVGVGVGTAMWNDMAIHREREIVMKIKFSYRIE